MLLTSCECMYVHRYVYGHDQYAEMFLTYKLNILWIYTYVASTQQVNMLKLSDAYNKVKYVSS